IADLGYSVRAHPWVIGGRDVAVMVSGNAMAHLYLELSRRERHWWPSLTARWQPLVDWLLTRDSVDLLLLPLGAGACRVLGARGESAVVRRDDDAALHYLRES